MSPSDSPTGQEIRPRIGYVLKVYPRFSETFVVSELIAREARGADIEIFSLRSPKDARYHETLASVRAPVSYVPHRTVYPYELWELLGTASTRLPRLPKVLDELLALPVDDATQSIQLAMTVQERGITHLHAHFGSLATTVARAVSLLTGIPYSFTAHAKDIFHDSVDPTDLARKLADAHHVVTVSEFNVRYLSERFPEQADRIRRVYNGVDVDTFAYTSPRDRSRTVLAVGRLVEKKGFSVLLDACSRLLARGVGFRCVLAGTGPLESVLRARVDELGLGAVVTFAGPLPQASIRHALSDAAVFAAPCVVGSDGNADGLPTVLLEAMALGTPCVSTDVTGIPEVLRDGETGLGVPQHDPDRLADAIERLLDDGELRDRLASRARALIEEEFASDRQAEQLDEALLATAANGRN